MNLMLYQRRFRTVSRTIDLYGLKALKSDEPTLEKVIYPIESRFLEPSVSRISL